MPKVDQSGPKGGAAGLLRRHNIHPRRSRGQNFLDDPEVLRRIVGAADVGRSDTVLEIGSGLGSLTCHLAQVAGTVVTIEVDAALFDILHEVLEGFSNVKAVHGDVLAIDLDTLGLPQGYIVAANIPYYITSPILRHLLESGPRPRRIVLTVQAEVAERLCAKPPAMSVLGVSVQIQGTAQVVEKIPARAFYPKPQVDSAVVRVDCFDRPLVEAAALSDFFRLVKAGFLQPRKTLRNSLAAGLGIPAASAESLLKRVGIDPRRRAETVDVDEWILLELALSTTGD